MFILLALPACGPAKAPEATAKAPVTPATVARPEFQHLRFLAGRWRGLDAGGTPFYERYAVLDDTTIRTFTFGDSTFRAPTDSGVIRWAGSQVRTGSAEMGWIATIWTPDSVRFEPEHGATNSFTWIRRSQDAWQARLEPQGAPRPRLYEMSRIPD